MKHSSHPHRMAGVVNVRARQGLSRERLPGVAPPAAIEVGCDTVSAEPVQSIQRVVSLIEDAEHLLAIGIDMRLVAVEDGERQCTRWCVLGCLCDNLVLVVGYHRLAS